MDSKTVLHHVEFFTKIKMRNIVSCWFYYNKKDTINADALQKVRFCHNNYTDVQECCSSQFISSTQPCLRDRDADRYMYLCVCMSGLLLNIFQFSKHENSCSRKFEGT